MVRSSEGHACAVWVATAGQQGPGLGGDEQPLVLLSYVIIELSANKIIGVEQYVIRPVESDEGGAVACPGAPLLGPEMLLDSALTDDLIKRAGQPLAAVINQFDRYIRSLQIDPDSNDFHLVTNGQLPLRQCLHPQACARSLPLPTYYTHFHDLHKNFQKTYSEPIAQDDVSIQAFLDYLGLPKYEGNDFYMKEAKDMANILQKMISDGFHFDVPETVDLVLEPGICSKDDEIDGNCIVRARGLPWQSSDQDIAKFFRGLNVAKGGVALCLSPQGRRNGEALVRFVSMEHRDMALKRHKHHIGNRYIEVYRATSEDFLSVAGGTTNEATAFLTRGAQVIIRMRGLPYDCTAQQVLDFFSTGANPCTVLDGVEGVLFVKRADGRATGDAFVLFAREEDSPKALAKHRELIGTRYIELFRSTTAEVQQVLNRSLDPKTYETPAPLIGTLPPVPLLPQHVITSGTLKDCIRLRGLPYEAQVENILNFLDEFANNIVFQGVHMVYNAQGQPSGEAFIQMDSETSAFLSAQQKHNKYMIFGKKQRYIEVFQCSGDDMNLVLTGGMASPSAGGKALSPGRSPRDTPPPPLPPLPPPSLANQTTVPPPPPSTLPQLPPSLLTTHPPPSMHALTPQIQAQLIAQQALLARQNNNLEREMIYQYLPNPYLAQQQHFQQFFANPLQTLTQQPPPNAATAAAYQQLHLKPTLTLPGANAPFFAQHPYLMFAPRFMQPPTARQPLMQSQTQMTQSQYLTQTALIAAAQQAAVKRSYENAFASVANDMPSAKKPFTSYATASLPTGTLPTLALPPAAYQQYFSTM